MYKSDYIHQLALNDLNQPVGLTMDSEYPQNSIGLPKYKLVRSFDPSLIDYVPYKDTLGYRNGNCWNHALAV